MDFKALNDRVVVKRVDDKEVTDGGLFIPDIAKKKEAEGTVLSVGSKITDIVVGDKVLFDNYHGIPMTIDDIECVMLREEHVFGVIERD